MDATLTCLIRYRRLRNIYYAVKIYLTDVSFAGLRSFVVGEKIRSELRCVQLVGFTSAGLVIFVLWILLNLGYVKFYDQIFKMS